MFIFQDPADVDELEQIEHRANPPATSVGAPLFLTVGLGGMGLFLTGSPIVGGSLAALPAYAMVKKLNRVWRNHVFLRRNPECYAHLIRSDRDMIAWIEAYGRDEVADQLLLAMRQGQKLTSCAKRTAKVLIKPDDLPPKRVTDYLIAAESPVNDESCTSTGLNGEQPNSRNSTQQARQQVGQDQDAHPQLQNARLLNVAEALGYNLKPTIVSARPRVGKGVIVSHTIDYAKTHHGVTVWVIQPKPHTDELGYWKTCDQFLGINLEDFPKDDPAVAARMTEFFLEWRSQKHRPILLIVDELVKIQALQPKWYKDFLIPQCIVEGSSGETDRRFLYLITQSPLVSDLGMTGGNRSTFDFMTIQKPETAEHLESVRKSITSLRSTPSPEDYRLSPVGCLVFHSAANCWFAVPEYPVPTIGPSDKLCPDLENLARPKPAYAVVKSVPTITPIDVPPPELPQEWEAIGRAMLAMNFTTEQPGTIRSDGTKEPINSPAGDPIELAILEFLKSRPEGATAGRIRADKKALKTVPLEDIEFYLSVLVEEGKIQQEGAVYHFVDRS